MKTKAKNGAHIATRAEILGVAPGTATRAEWRKHEKRLIALRERLILQRRQLQEAAKAGIPVEALHPAESASAEFDENLALSLLSAEQDALYEVEEALNRIRTGSYGTCEMTGTKIPQSRLNAVPWTRFCAEAENTIEQEHGLKSPRIAPPARVQAEAESDTGEEAEPRTE